MGKLYLSAKGSATRFRRRPKSAPNKKLATIGTVKRLINHNVDKSRSDQGLIVSQNVTTTAVITAVISTSYQEAILDSFECRGSITNPTLNSVVRIILFQWKDTTVPVIADILQATAGPLVLSSIGRGGNDYSCGGKMHLLWDSLSHMNTSTYSVKSFTKKVYKKRLLVIKGESATEIKNMMYICYLSDTAATPPVLNLTTSLVFHTN